ncbi:MAG: phosphate acetyltransferase [Rhodobacteraceae bacterium]|nr:MAG: phosphate acetyltransferase [Paracoccaceae bacterium]
MVSPFLATQPAVVPDSLLTLAKSAKTPRVAIARAGAPLPMQAAKQATDAGIMIPMFFGEQDAITAEALALDWDISPYTLHHCVGEQAAGMAAAKACGEGRADILMKGHLHTDVFMKAALNRDNGLRTGGRLVHVFHISHPTGGAPILLSDGAVNVAPDLETRQASAAICVDMLHKLGTKNPKVAFLSATESVIPAVPSSGDARSLRDWARKNIQGAEFSGPLALDLALSPQSAEIKGMTDDPVAGRADVLIVPDIVTGNTLFKAMVYMTGACAAGVVMGAKVPILLTSRADPAAGRMASVALAAIVSGS